MDTFRILMVLPSVFTRGWNPRGPIFTQKSTPGGGGPKTPFSGFRGTVFFPKISPRGGGSENPFFGVPGAPPHPPREGGRGGYPPRGGGSPAPRGVPPYPPQGGVPPLPGGGATPAKKDPPLGYPKFMHKFMTQIREGNYERGSAL